MRADGNFVIYGPAGALWATNMTGIAGVSLVAKNDASLVAKNGASLVAKNGASLVAKNGASLVSLRPRRHRGLGTA
jgi:hypothetical protein